MKLISAEKSENHSQEEHVQLKKTPAQVHVQLNKTPAQVHVHINKRHVQVLTMRAVAVRETLQHIHRSSGTVVTLRAVVTLGLALLWLVH